MERVSFDAVADATGLVDIWPDKLPRTLYALITDWNQEDVDVSHQEDTVTLQVTLDESYESMWEWERRLSLEFTLVVDAETYTRLRATSGIPVAPRSRATATPTRRSPNDRPGNRLYCPARSWCGR